MIYASTAMVARMLDVSPNTVREWVEQFGFPTVEMIDGRRAFDAHEVLVFRNALRRCSTVEAAITQARQSMRPGFSSPPES